MPWQDIVLSVGQWVFFAALLPAILGKETKPPLSTSVPTAVIAAIFAFVYTTLTLWISALSSLLVAAAWTVLAVQRHTAVRTKMLDEKEKALFRDQRNSA